MRLLGPTEPGTKHCPNGTGPRMVVFKVPLGHAFTLSQGFSAASSAHEIQLYYCWQGLPCAVHTVSIRQQIAAYQTYGSRTDSGFAPAMHSGPVSHSAPLIQQRGPARVHSAQRPWPTTAVQRPSAALKDSSQQHSVRFAGKSCDLTLSSAGDWGSKCAGGEGHAVHNEWAADCGPL